MRNTLYKGRFIFIPLGIAAILALVSFVVMQLWNNLLPDILHVTPINFWQAMGIFVLCKILFGFGPKGGRGGAPWMRRRQMMEEKLSGMSPQERERFKEQMKNRCGWGKPRNDWRESWQNEPIAEKETKE
ncbi:hypothetical protein [Mucilaginibacter phyllosphaerae]|uniref:DUF1682 domain-containing protein n=1 Tax=Mucilaginibacter phyllosphaerae TaxID=1812349 RepID=A0ABR6IDK4_9SPHI|nr:hypothetical protein [Mucilaginibacter phyllosphaerae]MBB3971119.1 hypothetical protein [Mucilaginibacter phyllosphaerae]GGH22586.1 hypothetical protein GCM10007352_35980 [Mucilaginibacter phyllosphaerae]